MTSPNTPPPPDHRRPSLPEPLSRRPHPASVGVLGCLLLAACAGGQPRPGAPVDLDDQPPGGRILTRGEIQATGARDAMEALERGGTHLLIQRTSAGGLQITHRGVDSFYIRPDVLVVVDDTRMRHPEAALRGIPAESIRFIQVLSGREAVLRYGAESGNGVILVRTSARP